VARQSKLARANIFKWEKSNFLEMLLQLGWGKLEEAAYRRGWPVSGSEYVHAVKPGKLPNCQLLIVNCQLLIAYLILSFGKYEMLPLGIAFLTAMQVLPPRKS